MALKHIQPTNSSANANMTAASQFWEMFDGFFDWLNVRATWECQNKRKQNVDPYWTASDRRFKVRLTACIQSNDIDSLLLYHMQWLRGVFLQYILDWEVYVKQLPGLQQTRRSYFLVLRHERAWWWQVNKVLKCYVHDFVHTHAYTEVPFSCMQY